MCLSIGYNFGLNAFSYHFLNMGRPLAWIPGDSALMSHVLHTNEKKKSGASSDRRNKARTVISTPVRVRGLQGSDREFGEVTTTLNLSPGGILIETSSVTYYRNMKIAVTLPYEERPGTAQPEQEGHVVRITESREGRRSVAIALGDVLSHETSHAKQKKLAHVSPSHAASGHRDASSHPPLVLVVESEVAASEIMKTYLSAEGYEVVTARTFSEARAVLEHRIPALVIAEVEGEGMPGYTLCTHCKQTYRLRRVPIVLVTSSGYPSDYAKAHSHGAIVCMAKPYKRERLGHVVRFLAPPPVISRTPASRLSTLPRQTALEPSKETAPPPSRRFRFTGVFGR